MKKQKIVMRYNWCVPYEASGTETIAFNYVSKEQAYVDFMTKWEKGKSFEFLGREWCPCKNTTDFGFYDLEEWFDKFKER